MLVVQNIRLIRMIIKKRIENGKIFLSVCDTELVGQVFEEDDKILDLKSSFYNGKEINKEDLKYALENAYFITAIGKKSIKYLLDLNIIDSNSVKKIQKIPYSLILKEN